MNAAVFTRFAVERDPAKKFFSTSKGTQWIDDALLLASKTSILSVSNLNPPPLFWYILVDSTLTEKLKKKIQEWFDSKSAVAVKLLEVDGWNYSNESLLNHSECQAMSLQIRLDYDDILKSSYIKQAVRTIGQNETTLFCPVRGFQWNFQPTILGAIIKDKAAFSALYRKDKTTNLTVFSYDHDLWPEMLITRFDIDELWIQTISGKNIMNKFGRHWLVKKFLFVKELKMNDWLGQDVLLTNQFRFICLRNIPQHIQNRFRSLFE
jgi:hypothetical protein